MQKSIKTDLLYDPVNYFWVKAEGNKARIGMSPLVEQTSGSFVAIQFSKLGETLSKDESFGSAEAEKHVGHMKMPVSGKILAINEKVITNPRLINTDPFNEGWLIEVELTNFPNEFDGLIAGEENIRTWFEAELKKFDEKGWLAQP
ncbi:MAG: hypothetical protein KDC85_06915 [Saprospiraceae bacterium]|nr:hypothetical protein [Saprospiraceae bacterium]MCB9323744.1 hypothetical protein [Lewinellaceae bacterium]